MKDQLVHGLTVRDACICPHQLQCLVLLCLSLRRNADDLRKSVESVVVPLFCISQLAVDEERQNKLKKVLLQSCYGNKWSK